MLSPICIHAGYRSAARWQWCAWLFLASSQLNCKATLTCDRTLQCLWHTGSHSSIKCSELWPHAQHIDWYLRWRQSLSLDVSAVMICVSVPFVGGATSLLTIQITYCLMWFSQAGRLLFSTSFVFSVKVHLINVVLCQGPADRLAGSPLDAELQCVSGQQHLQFQPLMNIVGISQWTVWCD